MEIRAVVCCNIGEESFIENYKLDCNEAGSKKAASKLVKNLNNNKDSKYTLMEICVL